MVDGLLVFVADEGGDFGAVAAQVLDGLLALAEFGKLGGLLARLISEGGDLIVEVADSGGVVGEFEGASFISIDEAFFAGGKVG